MNPLLAIYRHYARLPWLGLCLLLVAQLASTGSPLVFGRLVTMLSDGTTPSSWLWGAVAAVCALDVLHIACQYGFQCAIIRETAVTARRLKNEAVRRFLRLGAERREGTSIGEWERRICTDTQMVAQSVCPAMGEVASTLVSFCLVSAVMVWQQPLFLILVGTLALSFWGIYRLNNRRLRCSAMNARTTNYEESTVLLDFLALTPIMALFRVTQRLLGRFSRVTQQMERHGAEAERSSFAYTTQIRGMMVLGIAASLILSVSLCLMGQLEVGAVVSTMMLVGQISGQMGQLVFVVPTLARGAESAQALEAAFGLVSGREAGESPAMDVPSAPTPAEASAPLLCLRGVSFAYTTGRRILHGLDWVVQPGEYHSVLGSNGEGKSTLIRVILGSLPGCGGQLTRRFTRPGYVPQATAIFHGSFRENLTLCNESISDETLAEVIRMCRLDRLLKQLGGLDAPLAQEALSGGEVQRIGIARALAIGPDLLVVDEITNNLDIVNKAIIFRTLRELKGRCTVVSVSHDMEALADSDCCWLLHGGRLHRIPDGSAEQKRVFAFTMIESQSHAD